MVNKEEVPAHVQDHPRLSLSYFYYKFVKDIAACVKFILLIHFAIINKFSSFYILIGVKFGHILACSIINGPL